MKKFALVLEGGGLRGVYTAGVLDLFLDKDFHAPYIIGVSAGACQAYSYISKQRGRSFRVSADFINDHRYLSLRNLIFKGEIFGMDFMFDEIPQRLIPFDYDEFYGSEQEFVIGATNCATGLCEYFYKRDKHDMLMIGRASSSLPLLSKVVTLNNKPYLDGGIAMPIPLVKALQDGFKKNIVILTRDGEYRRKPSKHSLRLMKLMYRKYPQLGKTYAKRADEYNSMLGYIERQEKKGNVFVIRPKKPVTVGRMERDVVKLRAFYEEGYKDAKEIWPRLEKWVKEI